MFESLPLSSTGVTLTKQDMTRAPAGAKSGSFDSSLFIPKNAHRYAGMTS